MKIRYAKMFRGVCITCLVLAFILLFGNVFLGDVFFPATRYFSSPQSHFYAADTTDFSVAVAGDTGAENHVLESIIEDVRKSDKNYAFMLYLGDFVTRKNNTGLSWLLDEIQRHLKDLPFYSVPGNHDVLRRGTEDKSHYRSMLGSPYYWFGYGRVLFIGLDSSGEQIEDEQFEWLENTLTYIRPRFKHCVIYSHKPPKDLRPDWAANHRMNDETVDKFAKIIRRHKRKIDVMIFGHVHYFADGVFEGVPIYTIPESGQKNRGDVNKHGYASITFGKNGIKSIEPHYIDFSGPKREYIEYGIAWRILSHELRRMVSILLLASLVCFVMHKVTKSRK